MLTYVFMLFARTLEQFILVSQATVPSNSLSMGVYQFVKSLTFRARSVAHFSFQYLASAKSLDSSISLIQEVHQQEVKL